MSLPEIRNDDRGRPYIYRLIPGQRRHEALRLLAVNGPMTKNALYVNTSPACLAEGRTRSIGTYNDSMMTTLEDAGLVSRKKTYRGEAPDPDDSQAVYQARFRTMNTYTITPRGLAILEYLRIGSTPTFLPGGLLVPAGPPSLRYVSHITT